MDRSRITHDDTFSGASDQGFISLIFMFAPFSAALLDRREGLEVFA